MYQVLARKYRPQTFGELIGQEHVRATLARAIEQGRIAHGYIFSGQRGTGKTTVARILARCLNCVEGPTVHPCGRCSSCREIAAGSSVDVIEIDAASNRGINEIRELRENVRYRPARDRYKVFIIDEAHQITSEAFNALLKTLEEPPEWVVFVLCTTEAHKIPTTIASRCQHFAFRSVDYEAIIERLREICQREGVEADEETLSVLAQAGEGSVRDSLSALDQAIACCGNRLVAAEVRQLLGLFALESLEEVIRALEQSDKKRMLELVRQLERDGRNLLHFCRELARYFRNLLVVKIAGPGTRLVAASRQEQERLASVAGRFSEEDLTRFLNLTLELFRDMQYSLQPRLQLELGLLRMIEAGRLRAIEEVLAELTQNPGVAAGTQPSLPGGTSLDSPAGSGRGTDRAASEPERPTPAAASPESLSGGSLPQEPPGEGQELKGQICRWLLENKHEVIADAVEHAQFVREQNQLRVRAPKEFHLALRSREFQAAVKQFAPWARKVILEAGIGAADKELPSQPTDDELRERALSHPMVRRFQELFPGSQVRAVRNLKE